MRVIQSAVMWRQQSCHLSNPRLWLSGCILGRNRLSWENHPLTSFKGTDSVPSIAFVKKWYGAPRDADVGATVAGTQDLVISSYGKHHEFGAYERFLEIDPTESVSTVSNIYNYWSVLTVVLPQLKDCIIARKSGKVMIRPTREEVWRAIEKEKTNLESCKLDQFIADQWNMIIRRRHEVAMIDQN